MNHDCPDIRIGNPDDREGVLELAMQLAEENAAFPIDKAKVAAMVDKALHMQEGAVMGIAGPKEDPRGFICLDIVEHWYSNVPFYVDIANYVAPEHRKNPAGYARQQLRFSKEVSDTFQMPLFIAISSTVDLQPKIRLYEREFAYCGAQFFYVPKSIEHLFQGSYKFYSPKKLNLSTRERDKIMKKISEVTNAEARQLLEEVVTGRR